MKLLKEKKIQVNACFELREHSMLTADGNKKVTSQDF